MEKMCRILSPAEYFSLRRISINFFHKNKKIFIENVILFWEVDRHSLHPLLKREQENVSIFVNFRWWVILLRHSNEIKCYFLSLENVLILMSMHVLLREIDELDEHFVSPPSHRICLFDLYHSWSIQTKPSRCFGIWKAWHNGTHDSCIAPHKPCVDRLLNE